MIRFWCECGRQLQATAEFVGQEAVCLACGRATIVPPSDQPIRAVRPAGPFERSRHGIESGPPTAWQGEPTPPGARRSRAVVLGLLLGGLALLVILPALLLWRFSRAPRGQVDEPAETAARPAFTVEQLTEALSDEDPDVRSFAATKLSTMALGDKGRAAVEPLTKLLADPRDTIRASAAKALGQIGKEAAPAAGPMAPLLSDPDSDVRRTAAVALGQIGDGAEEAVMALSRALKDPDEDVRHAAADALGKIGPAAQSAVAALKDAARDSDQETRVRATRSLARIAP